MISVLIPVYNTPPNHLRQCIDSVLDQTEQNFEIVIIDNQSDVPEVIELLNELNNHEKITVLSCERQQGKKNLSVALNAGLKVCKYDLIARLDSDDIMTPDRLEKQLRKMQEWGAGNRARAGALRGYLLVEHVYIFFVNHVVELRCLSVSHRHTHRPH